MCCFLLCGFFASGQSKAYHVKIAYNGGMIVNPGLSAGIQYSLLGGTREKKRGPVSQELRVGLAAGFYRHRRLHTGLSAGPEINWIRTGPKGFQFGIGLGLGYLKTIIPNTFEVGDDGQVSRDRFSSTDHLFFSYGIRLGKSLRISRERNLEWYLHPKILHQTPYFYKTNRYFLLEAGVNFKIQ